MMRPLGNGSKVRRLRLSTINKRGSMKLIHWLTLFGVFVLMTGCAPAPYKHLEQDARVYIQETDVVLAVPQEEIYGDIDSSNITTATGGGLLFALIDVMVESGRAKKAEKAVSPLRDKLLDYDYAQVLADELDVQIKKVDWLSAKELTLERSVNDTWAKDKVSSSSASAVLLMTAKYHLSANLDSVETIVDLKMFPNTESLEQFKEKQDADNSSINAGDNIYRNNIMVSTGLFSGATKDENKLALQADDGTKLKDALTRNAKEVASKIHQDLNAGALGASAGN